jgi:hypothetical protein
MRSRKISASASVKAVAILPDGRGAVVAPVFKSIEDSEFSHYVKSLTASVRKQVAGAAV